MTKTKYASITTVKTNSLSKRINALLLACIIIVGVYYLAGVNDLAVKGFSLQSLRLESQTLAKSNREVESQIMNLESYAAVKDRLEELDMVAVNQVDYLVAKSNVVAKK